MDGLPATAPRYQPGMDESIPGEPRDLEDPPAALEAIPHDADNGWQLLDELDLVVGVMWFEGARYQAPVVHRQGESYRALAGFETMGDYASSVQLFLRGDHLLVCSDDHAHVYDRTLGYRRVWHAPGQCPVFWPLTE